MIHFLAILLVSDLSGIDYGPDGKVLISTPADIKNVKVLKECEIINGGNSQLKSSFYKSINSIQTITFEEGSKLKCIYPYVFYGSSLVSVDMTNCHLLTVLNYSLFRNCQKIETILLPEGLLTIKSGSLRGLSKLRTLKIPDSVTKIDGYADIHGGSITSPITKLEISSNSNLKSIGSDCFSGTKFTDFYIPKYLTSLTAALFNSMISTITIHSDNKVFKFDGTLLLMNQNTTVAFIANKGNVKVTIPSYVKSFTASCCRYNGVNEIVFEGDITHMESWCFASTNIVTFNFPNGISYSSNECCCGCKSLKTVILSRTITTIGYRSFYNCPLLSNITILGELKEIQNYAFWGDKSITVFDCPKTLISFGDGVFSGCSNLQFNPNGNPLFSVVSNVLYVEKTKAKEFFGETGEITIPYYCTHISASIFSGKKITKITIESNSSLEIGEKSFQKTALQSIVLPSCLTKIGLECFEGINTLQSVVFNSDSKLAAIPENCFRNCVLLQSVSLSRGLETIDINAFYGCKKLSLINIDDTSIKFIGARAFAYSGITTLTIPGTLCTLGEECFASSSLTELTMKNKQLSQRKAFEIDSLTKIQEMTFKNCGNLQSITIPSSVQELSKFSFSHCSSLVRFELPQDIELICSNAFEYCVNLEVVVIPLNCNLKIMDQIFSHCYKLVTLEVAENDEHFIFTEGILMSKNKTKIVVFLPSSKKTIFVVPAAVEDIGNYAFQGCKNLRTVIIPEGHIKSVGYQSFESCTSLSSLYLPSTLVSFSNHAFQNCPNLKCGSVVYENENIQNAINAGIPEYAINTICNGINVCTNKNCKRNSVLNAVFIAYLITY